MEKTYRIVNVKDGFETLLTFSSKEAAVNCAKEWQEAWAIDDPATELLVEEVTVVWSGK